MGERRVGQGIVQALEENAESFPKASEPYVNRLTGASEALHGVREPVLSYPSETSKGFPGSVG